jgi:hypothetical protein
VILGEVLARQQVIDKSKTLLQTFAHGNGHRAVQFDNRGWLNQMACLHQLATRTFCSTFHLQRKLIFSGSALVYIDDEAPLILGQKKPSNTASLRPEPCK